MILTYRLEHHMDFNQELSKARKIAEYAIKYRTFSSKDVKHIGLKSMIANQILRKFGNQRKARRVKSVKLIIPNQGIKLSKGSTTIEIPCLKCSFQYRFSSFEKVNQIEIGKEYVYMSVAAAFPQQGKLKSKFATHTGAHADVKKKNENLDLLNKMAYYCPCCCFQSLVISRRNWRD
jgi:putative transposase